MGHPGGDPATPGRGAEPRRATTVPSQSSQSACSTVAPSASSSRTVRSSRARASARRSASPGRPTSARTPGSSKASRSRSGDGRGVRPSPRPRPAREPAAHGPGPGRRRRPCRRAATRAGRRPARGRRTSASAASATSASTAIARASRSGATAGSRTRGVSSAATSTGTPGGEQCAPQPRDGGPARPDQHGHLRPGQAVLEVGAPQQVGEVLGLRAIGVVGEQLDGPGSAASGPRRQEPLERVPGDAGGQRQPRRDPLGRDAGCARRSGGWCRARRCRPASRRHAGRCGGTRGCRRTSAPRKP